MSEDKQIHADEMGKAKKQADGQLTEEELSIASGGASVGEIVITKDHDASSPK